MERIIEPEKTRLRLMLVEKIGEFISRATDKDNNIGWIPDNMVGNMTDAAFAVLMSINDTNVYIDENGYMKD